MCIHYAMHKRSVLDSWYVLSNHSNTFMLQSVRTLEIRFGRDTKSCLYTVAEEENTRRLRANFQNLFATCCDWRNSTEVGGKELGESCFHAKLAIFCHRMTECVDPFFYVLVRPGRKAAASVRCRWGTHQELDRNFNINTRLCKNWMELAQIGLPQIP